MAHTLPNALEMGQEARIVQIDFSAAFDRVNHQRILFKLCSVGVGGSVLSVLTEFLSYRSQYPNQKNICGAALALIAIMYGIMQGIIAAASLLATMALYRNGRDPQ